MDICPLLYHSIQCTPCFKSNSGDYKADNGNKVGTYTGLFRGDLDWENFSDFLMNHFKNKDSVKIIQLGASDGSEAYTQIISLTEKNSKNSEKFFPIKAYDINSDICNNAKSGYINLSGTDLAKLKEKNINTEKYFKNAQKSIYITNDTMLKNKEAKTYKALSGLTDNVNFQTADMFDVMREYKDDSNSVVLCRNVLYYLSEREIDHFTTIVASNLKKGSVFVTGEIDTDYAKNSLITKGFKKIAENIFEKE